MSKLKDLVVPISSSLKLSQLEKSGKHIVYGASGPCGYINSYKVDKDYIALVKDGAGVGHVFKINAKESFLGTMQGLIPKDGIDPNYVYYLIRHLNLGSTFDGATIPHIYFKNYGNCLVRDHYFQEQIEIAHNLGMLDESIKHRLILLNNLDELIKSRFVEMFGDPIHNTKNLPEFTLPELGVFGRGVSKHRPRNAPELLGGKYPLIQTGDVAAAELYIKSYNSTYSEKGFRQSKMWSKGTLCITIAANIAKTAILSFDSCFPDSVVGFNANEKTDNIFIHYWFSFFQGILEAQAPASAQKNINLKTLSELKVVVPQKTEQESFVAFVKQVDKSKSIVQQQIKDLQELLDKKMDEYFSS